ncbi:peptidase [Dipodfec virus UOA04_Rod_535]|nr:peptidase [Dipodfec virus UOA04_Rod_535]
MTTTALTRELSRIRALAIQHGDNSVGRLLDSLIFTLSGCSLESDLDYINYKFKHFTVAEFEISATAQRLGIKNRIPNDSVANNISRLVAEVLDPAREALGSPIYVSSGYRCSAVNKAVGGAVNSRHLRGFAADVSCSDNDRLYDILLELPHSELIYHKPHYIHVSL